MAQLVIRIDVDVTDGDTLAESVVQQASEGAVRELLRAENVRSATLAAGELSPDVSAPPAPPAEVTD